MLGAAALLLLLLVAFFAGIAGAFLGVGGGIILVPFLTLGLDVDQRIATAVSIVGVIATSSAAASVYVRDRMTNLRLGMFLEVATASGAVLGAVLAVVFATSEALALLFAIAVLYAASSMIRRRDTSARALVGPGDETGLAARLRLGDAYYERDGEARPYGVEKPMTGLAVGAVAGTASGMLGVGGGFIKVPIMHLVMKVPMRASVATSNFMIGVTAAASAFVYYFGGLLDVAMAAVVVLGVSGGTVIGTRAMRRTPPTRIRVAFAVFLAVVGVLMGLRAFGLKVI